MAKGRTVAKKCTKQRMRVGPYYERISERLRVEETMAAPFPDHLHSQAELTYLFDGAAEMRVGGRTWTLSPGDLCVCFPGVVHGYAECAERARGLMLIFAPELFGDFSGMMSHYVPDAPLVRAEALPEDVRFCMERLRRECACGPDERAARGYIQVILARVLPGMAMADRSAAATDASYDVLKYLAEHFTEPITLDSLSRALGVSKSYLSHTFSRQLGANFRTYVNTLRLDFACSLLRGTDRAVTQIAYESGFESQRTFNRAFFQQYGMTPSRYRQRNRLCPGTADSECGEESE